MSKIYFTLTGTKHYYGQELYVNYIYLFGYLFISS